MKTYLGLASRAPALVLPISPVPVLICRIVASRCVVCSTCAGVVVVVVVVAVVVVVVVVGVGVGVVVVVIGDS
jgi:hypothetical protein